MKLFGKKSCCGENCISTSIQRKESLKNEKRIKILGSGCAKCNALENTTRQAIDQLGLKLDIEHVIDFAQIASFGVMSTPALVIDGKVVSFGKVLSVEEATHILKENL